MSNHMTTQRTGTRGDTTQDFYPDDTILEEAEPPFSPPHEAESLVVAAAMIEQLMKTASTEIIWSQLKPIKDQYIV